MREFQHPNSHRAMNETKGLVTPSFYEETLRNDEVDFVAISTPHLTVGRAIQTPRPTPRGDDDPIVASITPAYDSTLGSYVGVDQSNHRIAIPCSPRLPSTPRVQSATGISPRALPRLIMKAKTTDSLCVEWNLSSCIYLNGVHLCIDDGKKGPFTSCFFWSAQDLGAHMRMKGRTPVTHIITNLRAASSYRVCLAEANQAGEPVLHFSRDAHSRHKHDTFVTAGSRPAKKPREMWNNPLWKPRWKPTPQWSADWQPEHVASPRHRFSQVRYSLRPGQRSVSAH